MSVAAAKRDEVGLSLWVILVGMLVSALVTALFIIPNLLGARVAAENGAAEHNLQVGLVAAKTFFSQSESFSGMAPGGMDATEPTLAFTTGPSVGPKSISFDASTDGNVVTMAALSYTGDCYYVLDVERITATEPVSGDFYSSATNPPACVATLAATIATSSSGTTTTTTGPSTNAGGGGDGHKCHTDHESGSGEEHERYC